MTSLHSRSRARRPTADGYDRDAWITLIGQCFAVRPSGRFEICLHFSLLPAVAGLLPKLLLPVGGRMHGVFLVHVPRLRRNATAFVYIRSGVYAAAPEELFKRLESKKKSASFPTPCWLLRRSLDGRLTLP